MLVLMPEHRPICSISKIHSPDAHQEIAANSDNIDYGEMVHVHNGTEDGTTGFTRRGVESLQEFLAEIRSWDGGVREFLANENCDPEMIERVMAEEAKLSV